MSKVLVVDDVADNVELLACELEDRGYEVMKAYDGPGALDVAAVGRPDVILLDITMPGMDGIEVCRRLKTDSKMRSIPVIMVSALEEEADVIRGLDAGAQDYIIKPLNNRIAMARVRSAAQAKSAYDLIAETNGKFNRSLLRLAALRRIDQTINTSLNLKETLDIVLLEVTTVLETDAADILLCDPHSRALDFATGRGFNTSAMKHAHLPLNASVAGEVVLQRRPLHLGDLARSTRQFARADDMAHEGVRAYFATPLVSKGVCLGVLEVFHRAPLKPEPEWLEFMAALAGQLAIVVENALLSDESKHSTDELIRAYDSTIEGWSRAVDMRDEETKGHSARVTELTLQLAQSLQVGKAELAHMRRGALLHDVGKLGIPDSILLKRGPLTHDEWVIMRRHPSLAYDWLSPIAFLGPALAIPYCHHEKWDGTGYPRGLAGEQIPLAARIFAVVDIWDALRSNRPYRTAWPDERIRDYIASLAGSHLDPRVVEAFLFMIAQDAAPLISHASLLTTTEVADIGETMQTLHKAAFASLLYRSDELVVLLDSTGRIQGASTSFATAVMMGQDPRGLEFLALLDSNSQEKVRRLLEQPFEGARTLELKHSSPSHFVPLISYSFCEVSTLSMRLLAAVGRDQEESLKLVAKVVHLNQELEESHRSLEQMAMIDPLTGLANRRCLFERLNALWSLVRRNGCFAWIIMADIDHFKSFNDTYGHQLGDEVLQAASHAMRNALRTEDLIARYGGEEFVMAGMSQHEAEVAGLADRILTAVRGVQVEWSGQILSLSVSLGIVVTEADQENLPWVALQAADRAMYRAKLNGRNRSEIEAGVQRSAPGALVCHSTS